MAPLLRAGLHELRFALRAQRELFRPKLPESKYVRCYGETATVESPTPTVIDAAGENGASSAFSDSSKGPDDAGTLKEISTAASSKLDNESKESPTDKLTNLILAKMRAKNIPSETPLPPTGSGSSKATRPTDKSREPGRADKWDQVMESMRNMAAKRREQAAKSSTGKPFPQKRLVEDQDDFSDLDQPSAQLHKDLGDLPSPDELFKGHRESSKHRETSLQSSNVKQKSKEPQAVSFSFLNVLETESSTALPEGMRSASDGNTSKIKDGAFQSSSKEAKPLSFEFLKPSDSKVELSSPLESKVSPPFGGQPKPNDAARPLFSNQNNQKRESSHLPGIAGTRARQQSLEDLKNEMNNKPPGHPSGHMVSIHNLPAQSNLALVKEALSMHGEIITSFRKPNVDGSYSAFVEFKTADAMEDALATKWLQIDSKSFSITRADAPITTVTRLSRVSASADNQVSAICEKFGQLDLVRKRGNGVYDVYYKAGELINMSAILDRLNEVTFNQRRWVAVPAPLLHPAARREVLRSSEGQAWHSHQMNQTLSRLEMGLEAMSVYFEDLKALVSMEDELTK